MRLLVEQVQSECETKIIESNEDKYELCRQLDDFRREQRLHDEQQTHTIQEITEINYKLSQELQTVRAISFEHRKNSSRIVFVIM